MNLLEKLVPAFREVRGPLATGFAWLAAIWLYWGGSDPHPGSTAAVLVKALDGMGDGFKAVFVSFVAYLVGSFAQYLYGPTRLGNLPADRRPPPKSSRRLTVWRVFPTADPARRYDEMSEQLWAEAELRALLAVPLVAVTAAVFLRPVDGERWHWPWLLLLFAPALLVLQARAYRFAALLRDPPGRAVDPSRFSERYSRAVEQVGSDSLQVRIGAVLELGQLALDSEDYRPPIVAFLVEFVRPLLPARGEIEGENRKPGPPAGFTLPRDAQLAVERIAVAAREGDRIVLPYCTAWLDAPGAELGNADLHGSELNKSVLRGARLSWADLSESVLIDSDFTGAVMEHVYLAAADLRRATLRGAKLNEADLTTCNLDLADLQEAELIHANLTGAKLTDASLNGANLSVADLTGANLAGAQLYGADLTMADLAGAQVQYAHWNDQTRWPNGFPTEAMRELASKRGTPPRWENSKLVAAED